MDDLLTKEAFLSLAGVTLAVKAAIDLIKIIVGVLRPTVCIEGRKTIALAYPLSILFLLIGKTMNNLPLDLPWDIFIAALNGVVVTITAVGVNELEKVSRKKLKEVDPPTHS